MAHAVDIHVGERLRYQRTLAGLTQEQLGDRVGIKFQQIQKYEAGINRVSASRLWDISSVLGVPVSYFFDDFADSSGAENSGHGDALYSVTPSQVMSDSGAATLIRTYFSIPALNRRRLLDMARLLSQAA